MLRLALVSIAAALVTLAPVHVHADSVPSNRRKQVPQATPAPRKDADAPSAGPAAHCRDGTIDGTAREEHPCKDHGGISTLVNKPNR